MIFYDILYVIKTIAEITIIYYGVKALQTYMRRL